MEKVPTKTVKGDFKYENPKDKTSKIIFVPNRKGRWSVITIPNR